MVKYVSKDIICAKMMHCNFRSPEMTVSDFINDELPAADVQPVKHGWWTYPYKDKDINQCSECRSCVQDKISNVREMFAYCPFCGARMDLKGR